MPHITRYRTKCEKWHGHGDRISRTALVCFYCQNKKIYYIIILTTELCDKFGLIRKVFSLETPYHKIYFVKIHQICQKLESYGDARNLGNVCFQCGFKTCHSHNEHGKMGKSKTKNQIVSEIFLLKLIFIIPLLGLIYPF